MNLRIKTVAIAGMVMLAGATAANADVFGFDAITANGATSVADGEAQFFMEVTDNGGGVTCFEFTNVGPNAGIMSEIYFDGAVLTGFNSFDESDPGVDYGVGASPGDLPSGNNVGFAADFAFEPNNPEPTWGIGAGESLIIYMDGVFADVLDALYDGDLVVGIHGKSFSNGESESFVNLVPAPGALALLMAAGMVGTRRRK